MSIVLLIVVALLCAAGVGMYNGLIALRNQVDNAMKQIDVQLKRRHSLIPNLVASVKGEMKFEQDTLEKVMQARAAAMGAGKTGDFKEIAAKEGALTSALGRLLAVSENYPQLKAHESVAKLMEETTTTENKLSFARQFYNDIATKFNTKQQVFPTNIFASMLGFKPAVLWELAPDAVERQDVKIDLTF